MSFKLVNTASHIFVTLSLAEQVPLQFAMTTCVKVCSKAQAHKISSLLLCIVTAVIMTQPRQLQRLVRHSPLRPR